LLGQGKSWLACALGHKACRDDFSVLYYRVPRLFAALGLQEVAGLLGQERLGSPIVEDQQVHLGDLTQQPAVAAVIRTRRNLIITGPCGLGKSWLACALGHKACRDDFSVLSSSMLAG
jgi:DNA replication protein DnaC